MSNLYLCPDDFWRCPIDLNHQVLAKRFQYHIRRCTIANPHIRRVRCVFNANHLTTPADLLNHMSTCPDAINASTVLIALSDFPRCHPWSDKDHRSSSPTDWQMYHDGNATEDWDDDIRERRAKNVENNEQVIVSTSIQSLVPSQHDIEYLHEKQQETIEHYVPSSKLQFLEDIKPIKAKKNLKSVAAAMKQAHVLKERDNDGQIHSVETDELTKNLMKIRTLQLIGGAGRGTCCLLRTAPPDPGFAPRK